MTESIFSILQQNPFSCTVNLSFVLNYSIHFCFIQLNQVLYYKTESSLYYTTKSSFVLYNWIQLVLHNLIQLALYNWIKFCIIRLNPAFKHLEPVLCYITESSLYYTTASSFVLYDWIQLLNILNQYCITQLNPIL